MKSNPTNIVDTSTITNLLIFIFIVSVIIFKVVCFPLELFFLTLWHSNITDTKLLQDMAGPTSWFFRTTILFFGLYLIRLYMSFEIFSRILVEQKKYTAGRNPVTRTFEIVIRILVVVILIAGVSHLMHDISIIIINFLMDHNVLSDYFSILNGHLVLFEKLDTGYYLQREVFSSDFIDSLTFTMVYFTLLLVWDMIIITNIYNKKDKRHYFLDVFQRFTKNHLIGLFIMGSVFGFLFSKAFENIRYNVSYVITFMVISAIVQFYFLYSIYNKSIFVKFKKLIWIKKAS